MSIWVVYNTLREEITFFINNGKCINENKYFRTTLFSINGNKECIFWRMKVLIIFKQKFVKLSIFTKCLPIDTSLISKFVILNFYFY